MLETLVVLRNVRDSRFRREPYRKRKRASTYISPIHAERPTNDAGEGARGETGGREREGEGCGRVGRRGREEGPRGVRQEYRGEKRGKKKGKREKNPRGKGKKRRKRKKAGRGPPPISATGTLSSFRIAR